MEVKIGNFKGPKGDTGNPGKQGERGNRWYSGTVITGTSNAATVFSESGITDALKNDMYINKSTSNIYRCTVGGNADTAQWVYEGNIKGEKGEKGAKGDPGKDGSGTVATVENAGTVKPSNGLTVDEDGALSVSIDGTTLTMDEVNNVIKLADTLKNAINRAFPAANVANNQTTTEAGFALDARQANPNIDGTLAKQISDLNGSWESKVSLCNIDINNDIERIEDAFEQIFDMLPCGKAFIAQTFYNGMWLLFGFIYQDKKYGIIYGSRWEGTKHRCICANGTFSHASEW